MKKIPIITSSEYELGTIKHLPKLQLKFCKTTNIYNKFIRELITHDWTQERYDRIIPRKGVDKVAGLRVVHSLLKSPQVSIEIRVAGAAQLLAEWFIICK